jgi:exopolysaccharide biosynthesis WecB/TagA/CpsF family protein
MDAKNAAAADPSSDLPLGLARPEDLRPWPGEAHELYGVRLHRIAAGEVLERLVGRHPRERFAYVVTPNVDHVVRLQAAAPEVLQAYGTAWLSLCDSAVLSLLSGTVMRRLPVVAGSDLVEALFERLDPAEPVTVVGADADGVERLRRRFGFARVAHHAPPMGVLHDAGAMQACVDFVLAHPARFAFLAIGSPQQEILAYRVHRTGRGRGVGLCIGSSIRFLTGAERRAPPALRGSGLEWAFRLAQDPRRLWRRYLVQAPRIFPLAVRHALRATVGSARGRRGGLPTA